MQRDPERQVMEKAYARWAPVYDALCGPVFLNGRRAAASAARDVGGRILEIGVGTGLSFADYDATTEITGIDISGPMIARARERTKNGRYPFVTSRGLGAGAWWCRVDRTAQGQPARRLHAGTVSPRCGAKRCRLKCRNPSKPVLRALTSR